MNVQSVSTADNLHEISKPVFREKFIQFFYVVYGQNLPVILLCFAPGLARTCITTFSPRKLIGAGLLLTTAELAF